MKGFEQNEGSEELRTLDLGPLVAELEKYNDAFGLGALLSRNLLDGLKLKPAEDESGEEAPIGSEDERSFQQPEVSQEAEAESQQAFLARVEGLYGITLAKTGTKLEAVKGGGVMYIGSEKLETSALKVNLADSRQFAAYLSALDPESITLSQTHGLMSIANILNEQLLERYDADGKDKRTAELMDGLDDIVSNYRRLDPQGDRGLAAAVQELPVLRRAHKGDYLPQYLEAHRQNLLAEVGGRNFGPSKWHTDTTEERYKEYWTRAVKTLESLKKNPQAMELHTELLSNLIASAEYARDDMKRRNIDDNPARVAAKLKVLEGVLGGFNESVN